MIFARLFVHRNDCYESTPYLFCSKCKALLLRDEYHFCPWCGHKLHPANKVQIIETNESELSDKSFADKINFVRNGVKWERMREFYQVKRKRDIYLGKKQCDFSKKHEAHN